MFIFSKGQQIGPYSVVFQHKQGAYAETYRVRDEQSQLRFLKLIRYADLSYGQFNEAGLVAEVEMARQLHHPNLCQCIDSGTLMQDGQQLAYIVYEFVSGETLDRRQQRKQLSVYEVRQVMTALLRVLDYLHSQPRPVVHNEVTLENILLDLTGQLDALRLIDFGSVRFADQEPVRPSLLRQNPFFMAPERFFGVASPQTDLFAAGAVMYTLVFHRLPWFVDVSGLDEQAVQQAVGNMRMRPLTFPNLPVFELTDQLLAVIYKSLQLDVTERFQSAREFLDALEGRISLQLPPTHQQPTGGRQGGGGSYGGSSQPYEGQQGTWQSGGPQAASGSTPPRRRGNGFADVAGMDDLKQLLRSSVINILKNTERAKKYKLTIPNGMLLYGPPGCGKSFFAEKFAEETGYNYLYVKSSDLASIYVHGSQEKIGQLFSEARAKAPTIICFDEFDSLVPHRDKMNNASQSGEVNEFLTQLNNCGQDGVFVIASTNKPELIDPAVLRRGRIDRIIYLPVPDAAAREAMFAMHLKDRPLSADVDCAALAARTEGYVASDIAFIANEAAMRASEADADITQQLLFDVIGQSRPSLSRELIRQYEQMRSRLEGISATTDRPKIGF